MTTNAVSGLATLFTVEGAYLGAARNYNFSGSQAMIDATSDDSSRWGEYLVGRREWTIDIDMLYIYDDPAQIYLEEHWTGANPTSLTIIWTMPDTRTYTGTALLTSYNLTSAYEDVITCSVSLQGSDGITTSTS